MILNVQGFIKKKHFYFIKLQNKNNNRKKLFDVIFVGKI